MRFREALIKAAEQAAKEGEITHNELLRIRLVRPRIMREMELACCEQLEFTGKMRNASPGTIDWSSFLEFLKQLIQMILELFN
jgi:hypothetical protein